MRTEEMRLDGTAAGEILRQIFAYEMTAAIVTCVDWRSSAPVAARLD